MNKPIVRCDDLREVESQETINKRLHEQNEALRARVRELEEALRGTLEFLENLEASDDPGTRADSVQAAGFWMLLAQVRLALEPERPTGGQS